MSCGMHCLWGCGKLSLGLLALSGIAWGSYFMGTGRFNFWGASKEQQQKQEKLDGMLRRYAGIAGLVASIGTAAVGAASVLCIWIYRFGAYIIGLFSPKVVEETVCAAEQEAEPLTLSEKWQDVGSDTYSAVKGSTMAQVGLGVAALGGAYALYKCCGSKPKSEDSQEKSSPKEKKSSKGSRKSRGVKPKEEESSSHLIYGGIGLLIVLVLVYIIVNDKQQPQVVQVVPDIENGLLRQ